MNLPNYEPDFVAIDRSGTYWLLETKGQESVDALRKDVAALRWCGNASNLGKTAWKYVKVPQKEFEALQPSRLSNIAALQPLNLVWTPSDRASNITNLLKTSQLATHQIEIVVIVYGF